MKSTLYFLWYKDKSWFDKKIPSNHTTTLITLHIFTNFLSNQHFISCDIKTKVGLTKKFHQITQQLLLLYAFSQIFCQINTAFLVGWPKNDGLTTIWPKNHKFAIPKASDMLKWANWCFLNVPNCTLIDQKLNFWPIFWSQFWPKGEIWPILTQILSNLTKNWLLMAQNVAKISNFVPTCGQDIKFWPFLAGQKCPKSNFGPID